MLQTVVGPLRGAGYYNADAADLAAARTALSQYDIVTLAVRLTVPVSEFTRALTADEGREWAFYRASAANPRARVERRAFRVDSTGP